MDLPGCTLQLIGCPRFWLPLESSCCPFFFFFPDQVTKMSPLCWAADTSSPRPPAPVTWSISEPILLVLKHMRGLKWPPVMAETNHQRPGWKTSSRCPVANSLAPVLPIHLSAPLMVPLDVNFSRERDTAPSPVGLIFITMCNDCSKKLLFLDVSGQRNKRSIVLIKIVQMSPVSLYLLFWISAFWTVDCSVIKNVVYCFFVQFCFNKTFF